MTEIDLTPDAWMDEHGELFNSKPSYLKARPLYLHPPILKDSVRVRFLEWGEFNPKHRIHEEIVSRTPFGRYSIVFIGEWQLYWNMAKKPMSRHETAISAMDAAQADHDKRVLDLISICKTPAQQQEVRSHD